MSSTDVTAEGAAGRGPMMDVETLTALLREAEGFHGAYEPTAPPHHWATWYAGYIVGRDHGMTTDEAVRAATLHTEGALR